MTPLWLGIPTQRIATVVGGDVREYVRVRAFVRVWRACVRACVRDVFAIYDNNILPKPIMIIIKIISYIYIS